MCIWLWSILKHVCMCDCSITTLPVCLILPVITRVNTAVTSTCMLRVTPSFWFLQVHAWEKPQQNCLCIICIIVLSYSLICLRGDRSSAFIWRTRVWIDLLLAKLDKTYCSISKLMSEWRTVRLKTMRSIARGIMAQGADESCSLISITVQKQHRQISDV